MQFWCEIDKSVFFIIVYTIAYMDTLSAQIDVWSDICQKWLEIV